MEDHFFALPLLMLDLGQQQFLSAIGAVDVAGAELGGKTVALTIE